jgi:hypothetical protein
VNAKRRYRDLSDHHRLTTSMCVLSAPSSLRTLQRLAAHPA